MAEVKVPAVVGLGAAMQDEEGRLKAPAAATLDLLRTLPGATIQEVADRFGLAHSTAKQRVETLRRHGLIWQERHGNRLLHFAGPNRPERAQLIAALSRDERHRRLLTHLEEGSVADQSIHRISREARLPYGFVHRTLRFLDRCGVIRLEHRAGAYRLAGSTRAVATRTRLEERPRPKQ